MANGYGVGLFDSKGPEGFASSIDKIVTSLTGVQTAFTTLGSRSASSLQTIAAAVTDLTSKLSALQQQMQSVNTMAPGGGGPSGGGKPPGLYLPGPGGAGKTGVTDGSWQSPSSVDAQSTFASAPASMVTATAAAASPGPTQQKTSLPQDSSLDARYKATASMVKPQQGGSLLSQAASTLLPAAAGSAANFVSGKGASMISTAVQGATIGQMEGNAFGVSAKSMYVIPGGTLSQNAGDYAQANYYAMMNMGAAPGTQNWSTVQKGANQLMTLVPGMSRQGAMTAQNQMQQPGVLNRSLAIGLNLRPAGQMQTPEQQYGQIFNRLTMGGNVNAKTFAAMMAPGAPGAVNMEALGIAPGSDAYYGFMQYSYTKLGLQSKGKTMPDVATSQGAKQAGLDTPYYAQLQAQSSKSQLESRTEPGIASAAKTLNEAATKLLNLVNPLGSVLGGAIGGAGKMFGGVTSMLNPMNLMKGLFPKFQGGGSVDGPLNEAMLAIVHGGERVLTPGMGAGGQSSGSGSCGCGSGIGGFPSFGGIGGAIGGAAGDIGGFFKRLLGGVGGAAGGIGGLLGGVGGDVGGFFGRVGGDAKNWGEDALGLPGKAFGGAEGVAKKVGGGALHLGQRAEGDLHQWLKDIPIIGAFFGGSIFGTFKSTAERAKQDIHNWLKDVPGIGALFGGSAFGAAKGAVHGAMHKVGGLIHGAGHVASSLFHGAEHVGGSLLHGVEGLFHHKSGGSKDSAIDMLTGKLTDIKDTALYSLLTPVPRDSLLATLAGTAAGGGGGPSAPPAKPPPAKQTGPQPATPAKKGGGGILGGAERFLGSLGGDVGGFFKGLGQGLVTGTPAAASPASKSSSYNWSYQRSGSNMTDYSGMYVPATTASTSGSSGGTGSSSTAGGTGNPSATSNVPAGGDYTPTTWAQALLTSLGFPTTSANTTSLVNWENREGGHWHNTAKYNPLNTTQPEPGYSKTGSQGNIGAYVSWQQGLQATITTLQNGNYSDILAALQAGNGLAHGTYPGLSKWSGGGYSSLARGSQLIERNQLAMLHRGEAVIPAADNYSTNPYNRHGAVGNNTTHLNFKAGSVVLQVPPGSTQSDMDTIASQFAQAISKPQLLSSARSQ